MAHALVRCAAMLASASALAASAAAAVDTASPATSRTPAHPVAATATAVVSYSAPVSPLTVLRDFDPPATRYGPGHLGVDLRTTDGQPVVAAAEGTVTFAAKLADRGVVVIVHPDGMRTEYEPVSASVRRGSVVRRGDVIGHVTGAHPGCPHSCLHWGARRNDSYINPLSLLSVLGQVTLLPWR